MPPERHDPTGDTSPALTRRSAVTGALATTALLVATRPASARQATPVPDASSYLFVQACEAGTAAPTGDAGVYDLTLQHASGQTLFFSDRPERIAGIAKTDALLDEIAVTNDPPNAALAFALDGSSDEIEVAIVELTSPSADPAAGTIAYRAHLIDAGQDQVGDTDQHESITPIRELPISFGQATLFIDSLVEPGQSYIIFDTEG